MQSRAADEGQLGRNMLRWRKTVCEVTVRFRWAYLYDLSASLEINSLFPLYFQPIAVLIPTNRAAYEVQSLISFPL